MSAILDPFEQVYRDTDPDLVDDLPAPKNARPALDFTGVVPDLPIEVYHRGPQISKSGLDDIDRSPAYWWAMHRDPNAPARETTAAQMHGTLAHCAILEPAEFKKRYAIVPKGAPKRPTDAQWNAAKPSPSSVAAMEWWTEFNAKTAGAEVISSSQYDTAMRQAESVRKLPDVRELLDAGAAELSGYWTDLVTGVRCRCRPDWAHPVGTSGTILVDVKTFSRADPFEFIRQIARMRYHVQDAMYWDGWQAATGVETLSFLFVAVETEYPHQASVLMLDEESRQAGRDAYRRNLATFAECDRTDNWPAFGDEIHLVTLPSWAMKD